MPKPFRTCLRQGAHVAALLAFIKALAGTPARAAESLLQGIWWGEPQSALLAHFGARATVLQRPIESVSRSQRSSRTRGAARRLGTGNIAGNDGGETEQSAPRSSCTGGSAGRYRRLD
jgi:hypothetical protein